NPFNPITSIEYSIPSDGYVQVEIINNSGQRVDTLVDGYMRRGSHVATWNAQNHSTGIYYYRFRFGGFSDVKKMLLLK
ncbi:T9SS type A sorting domain-containing protein, partial [Candidatus Latescibacterota bacterium]